MSEKKLQSYKQAHWRTRIQRAGWLMLIVFGFIFTSVLYLNISGQAANAGFQIISMQIKKQGLLRSIASDRAELANLTSATQMQKRAEALGYKPISTSKAIYVMIPGYAGKQVANMAPPPGSDLLPQPILKASYTQSLWEVIFQQTSAIIPSTGGRMP